MLVKWHIITGFIISYILVYFFNFPVLAGTIIFLSSFIIDVDHYFYYAYIKKDLSPFNAVKWFYIQHKKFIGLTKQQKANVKHAVNIFHGIGFWVILLILSFYYQIFFWILLGVIIHIIPDIFYTLKHEFPISIKLCPLIVYIKNKKAKSFEGF